LGFYTQWLEANGMAEIARGGLMAMAVSCMMLAVQQGTTAAGAMLRARVAEEREAAASDPPGVRLQRFLFNLSAGFMSADAAPSMLSGDNQQAQDITRLLEVRQAGKKQEIPGELISDIALTTLGYIALL